jgi:PAS domain S-box-containing protein
MNQPGSISRTSTRIAVAVAFIVALAMPVGYLGIAYQYVAGGLETEAEIDSGTISQLISRDPNMWTYEQLRLNELLSRRPEKGYALSRSIFDLQGRKVAGTGNPLEQPLMVRSADLIDSGVVVGKVSVSRSLRFLVVRTGIAALLGASLGLAVFVALKVLPLRAMREAEEMLRESEEKYRSVVETTDDFIFVVDREGTYLFMNRNYFARRGLEETGYRGCKYSEFHSTEETRSFMGKICEVFARGNPMWYEHGSQADGRFFLRTLSPIREGSGKIAAVSVISKDITELKRMQKLMIQTEKMMAVEGLAAGAAHEINNPLNIIVQAAQMIERRVSKDLPANREAAAALGLSMEQLGAYLQKRQVPEFVGGIRDAAGRAARIVSNLMQFSTRSGLGMGPVSLARLVDQTVDLAACDHALETEYHFHDADIIRDYQPGMPDVPVVAAEIEQVILNLLKNAAQAIVANPPGRKPTIWLRLRQENDYAVIEVADNGPGMEEHVKQRVFEPFFTTKGPGVGTGLGLSVSYMIVTMNHKGLMSVESSPGEGACFTVRLPLEQHG